MNSLTFGFFYAVGLSWALSETCVIASNGNWLPLIAFLVLFMLMFSVLGCARVSDRTVEVWGAIFALMLAGLLVFLSFQTAVAGAVGAAVVKGVFSLAYVAAGVLMVAKALKPAASH